MGNVTSNLALYSGIVGAFLPVAIAAVQQWHWPAHVRSLVAFGICAAAAAGTAWLEGDFTAKGVTAAILIVLTMARSTYAAVWKPTGISDHLEAATSGTTVDQVRGAQLQAQLGTIAQGDVRNFLGLPHLASPGEATIGDKGREVVLTRDAQTVGARDLNDAVQAGGMYAVVGPEPQPIPADQDPLAAASAAKDDPPAASSSAAG